MAAAGIQSLALGLRRVQPYPCLAVMLGGQIAIIAAAPDLNVRGPASLIAIYTIGSLATVPATLVATGCAVVVEGAAGIALMAWQPADTHVASAGHLGSSAVAYRRR